MGTVPIRREILVPNRKKLLKNICMISLKFIKGVDENSDSALKYAYADR